MKSSVLILGTLGLLAARSSFGAIDPHAGAPRIRIRIGEAVSGLKVRGLDLRVTDGNKKLAVFERISEWTLRCSRGMVMLQSDSQKPLVLKRFADFRSPAGFVSVDSRRYRDEIRIIPIADRCDVVNTVGLEPYLNGLINSEFSSAWNEEAIAAQAVAARTYAYHQILQRKSESFDVDATTRDQVYDGSTREDFRAARIVGRTRGMVLTVGAKPIKAFYHSTCGGKTELPENVWGTRYLGFRHGVSCPFCRASSRLKWQLDLEEKELKNVFAQNPTASLKDAIQHGEWVGLKVGKLNPQNRVSDVASEWLIPQNSGLKTVEFKISAAKLRELVGATRIRSTAFQVEEKRHFFGGRYWHFSGVGNGHGVGLCQMGAKTMGELGHKMPQILKFYYPDVKISKLW